MTPEVLLIHRPAIDFQRFLGVSHKVLGYSLAATADQSHRELDDAERFLSCLAAMKDEPLPAFVPRLLSHVAFSVLLVADEADMVAILETCAAMPFVTAETVMRHIHAAVVSGTLAQWRDAVASGSVPAAAHNVRACFNRLHALFISEGLNVWTDFRTREAPQQTFFLEDKR